MNLLNCQLLNLLEGGAGHLEEVPVGSLTKLEASKTLICLQSLVIQNLIPSQSYYQSRHSAIQPLIFFKSRPKNLASNLGQESIKGERINYTLTAFVPESSIYEFSRTQLTSLQALAGQFEIAELRRNQNVMLKSRMVELLRSADLICLSAE